MDPKLLKEDEDETMHYSADVDALLASLTRYIEGNASTSETHDSVALTGMSVSYKSPALISESGLKQVVNSKTQCEQLPTKLLLATLKPHLDEDKDMELRTVYNKLTRNNQLQPQALSRQQDVRRPLIPSSSQLTDPRSFILTLKGSSSSAAPACNDRPSVKLHAGNSTHALAGPNLKPPQVAHRIPPSAALSSKTPPKKHSNLRKRPLEVLGSSPPAASKKQMVSAVLSDQKIEQVNDVMAVSGINLLEEEEQLFAGFKEDSLVLEVSRRVVQEEEERLILQKPPLRKKVADIMAKCGVKNFSNDVEKCLSLSVEERMRSLISSMIRMSKQKIDLEKLRHRVVVTSDVRLQILTMNQKAKDEWEKKQGEAKKLRKGNESDSNGGNEVDKRMDDGLGETAKEDEKRRTRAANVAVRAAVGGDDVLSRWQLMAEQNWQKRLLESASLSRGSNHQGVTTRLREGRTISIKDVIAVMEHEPQLSKSTLMYVLLERRSLPNL